MTHIPKVIIKTVAPDNQRYPTCGDYIYDKEDDTLTVFVSRMSNWRSELAVAIHEVFEAIHCMADEVEFCDIDFFDMQFEQDRAQDKHGEFDEPGDEKAAPYHRQHVAADFVEREVCAQSDLKWEQHCEIVNEAL